MGNIVHYLASIITEDPHVFRDVTEVAFQDKILFSEGRKNLAYRQSVTDGTYIVFDKDLKQKGIVIIRKLTTPEALQHWSRHSCPNWHEDEPDENPICTVVYRNAVDYLKNGPAYYVEVNGRPEVMATPADGTYFSYSYRNYYMVDNWLIDLINQLDRATADQQV